MQQPIYPPTQSAFSLLVTALRDANYEFVTPSPATHSRVNSRQGNEQARALADVFGWSRPFERTILPSDLFETLKEGAIIREAEGKWVSNVRASTLEGETFLHSAFPTLSADAVFFGPDTYRFANAIRSGLAARPRRMRRAVDIGCGTGAGAVVISKNATCDEIIMTDINETALQFARINSDAAGVRASAVRSDLFENLAGDFDLIVANPPYLNDPLRRAYRHGGGELGSALTLRIAEAAKSKLALDGTLILYTGSPIVSCKDRLRQALARTFKNGFSWSYEEVDPDVFGEELETKAYSSVDRIAAVVLVAKKLGA